MTRLLTETRQLLGRFDEPGVIDCDGHIFEPLDLWQNYLEPQYQDRGFKYEMTPRGLKTTLDGKPYEPFKELLRGENGEGTARDVDLHELFPVDRRDDNLAMNQVKGQDPYDRMRMAVPFGSMDPTERIALLDAEGIEAAILYPTMNLVWQAVVDDVALAMALARAYNRWIEDFCRGSGGRPIPIAHLVIEDAEGSTRELERAVKNGARGGMIVNFTLTRKPLGHPDHFPLWQKAVELNVPISLHPTLEPRWASALTRFRFTGRAEGTAALYYQGEQQAFASMFCADALERFPTLKLGILESGAGWIGHTLDRMDTLFLNSRRSYPGLKMKPSEYFQRHCFISADPDERALAGIIPIVGEDFFMWATDYPHPDHDPTYVDNMKQLVRTLTPAARRKILGDNAKRIFGITGPQISAPTTTPTSVDAAAAR